MFVEQIEIVPSPAAVSARGLPVVMPWLPAVVNTPAVETRAAAVEEGYAGAMSSVAVALKPKTNAVLDDEIGRTDTVVLVREPEKTHMYEHVLDAEMANRVDEITHA